MKKLKFDSLLHRSHRASCLVGPRFNPWGLFSCCSLSWCVSDTYIYVSIVCIYFKWPKIGVLSDHMGGYVASRRRKGKWGKSLSGSPKEECRSPKKVKEIYSGHQPADRQRSKTVSAPTVQGGDFYRVSGGLFMWAFSRGGPGLVGAGTGNYWGNGKLLSFSKIGCRLR